MYFFEKMKFYPCIFTSEWYILVFYIFIILLILLSQPLIYMVWFKYFAWSSVTIHPSFHVVHSPQVDPHHQISVLNPITQEHSISTRLTQHRSQAVCQCRTLNQGVIPQIKHHTHQEVAACRILLQLQGWPRTQHPLHYQLQVISRTPHSRPLPTNHLLISRHTQLCLQATTRLQATLRIPFLLLLLCLERQKHRPSRKEMHQHDKAVLLIRRCWKCQWFHLLKRNWESELMKFSSKPRWTSDLFRELSRIYVEHLMNHGSISCWWYCYLKHSVQIYDYRKSSI